MLDRYRLEFQELQKSLSEDLSALRGRASLPLVQRIITTHERLAGYLYRLRRVAKPEDPYVRGAEDYFSEATLEIMNYSAGESDQGGYDAWLRRYRAIWRENA